MSDEIEETHEAGGEVNADAIAEVFSDDHHDDDDDNSMYHAFNDEDAEDDSIDTNFEIMDSEDHW
jgi:hypothetical protein